MHPAFRVYGIGLYLNKATPSLADLPQDERQGREMTRGHRSSPPDRSSAPEPLWVQARLGNLRSEMTDSDTFVFLDSSW
jgi:hypothetical protein